jgi:hypothetical protein
MGRRLNLTALDLILDAFDSDLWAELASRSTASMKQTFSDEPR